MHKHCIPQKQISSQSPDNKPLPNIVATQKKVKSDRSGWSLSLTK